MTLRRWIRRKTRRLRRGLVRVCWLFWMPVALACDIVGFAVDFATPLSPAASSMVGLALVHISVVAAAFYFGEGAAAAKTVMRSITSALSFDDAAIVLTAHFEIRQHIVVLLFDLARCGVLLVLLLSLVLLKLCAAASTLAVNAPWTFSIVVTLFLVSTAV